MTATTAQASSQGSYPNLADLVSQMAGVDSANGWDVVCSYEIGQLNALLGAQYDEGKLATEVKLSTNRSDPLTGATYTITYDIRFSAPTLSFLAGRSGFAQLNIPIGDNSSYTVTASGSTSGSTTPIPGDTYAVTAVVPLAAVNGSTGAVAEQGNVVAFSDTEEHDNTVILHFQNADGSKYGITPTPSSSDTDALVTYFLPVLEQYFTTQVTEVDYVLASINNQQPAGGATVLTPASFVFAAAGDGDSGVLSLYIQTKESGNPAGNPYPSFQPGDTATLPIPDGWSASIVLSNALVRNAFLAPQLQESFGVSWDTPAEGIQAELTTSQSIVAQGKSGGYVFDNYQFNGLDISLTNPPLLLEFVQGNVSLHWHTTVKTTWSLFEAGIDTASTQYGTVDITLDLNKGPIPLTVTDSDMEIASIDLQSSDFQVTTTAETCSFGQRLLGCSETVPAYYTQGMTLEVPKVAIALTGLDFFATTNLVAPDSRVIAVDGSAGVQTPHDFLIVGNVASPS